MPLLKSLIKQPNVYYKLSLFDSNFETIKCLTNEFSRLSRNLIREKRKNKKKTSNMDIRRLNTFHYLHICSQGSILGQSD